MKDTIIGQNKMVLEKNQDRFSVSEWWVTEFGLFRCVVMKDFELNSIMVYIVERYIFRKDRGSCGR